MTRTEPEGQPGGSKLLERASDLATLDGLVSVSDMPGARMGLIIGAAGIGKTSLLSEMRQRFDANGTTVLTARGTELEREYPYGVVRQLFEPMLADSGAETRLLDGAAAAAAAVFEHAGQPPAAGGSGFATLHGLFWMTLRCAGEKPLALVIDDLHWSDSPSLRFIAYLVRRLEELPIVVLAATRPDEPGADARLIGEIESDPLTVSVRPRPLTEEGAGTLVERLLGESAEPKFVAACREATGGNPLLLGELLAALAVEGVKPLGNQAGQVEDLGPKAVSRAILLRLGRLSTEARTVSKALAILGDGAELWLLSSLTGLGEQQVVAATKELQRADVVEVSTELSFIHPVVRASVYGDLSPAEREFEHGKAAHLLRDANAPTERIASHLLPLGPKGEPWVAEALREAGREAAERGAPDSAAAYLARALAEPPREDQQTGYLIELALVQALTDLTEAVPTLKRAFMAARDPHTVALLANLLGRALLFSGEPVEGAAIARRTIESLPEGFEDEKLGLLALESAAAAFEPDLEEERDRLASWRQMEKVESTGEKKLAAVVAHDWTDRNGSRERCVELALAALDGGDLIEADGGLLSIYAISTLWLADREETSGAWEKMFEVAHRSGSLLMISTIQLWHGYDLYRRGDLSAAESSLREGFESFRLYGYRIGRSEDHEVDAYLGSILGQVLLARGAAGEARALFEGTKDPERGDAARYWLTTSLELLLEEGRFEEVLSVADQFPARLPRNRNPTTAPWRTSKAMALARLDRQSEAISMAEEELELSREWGAPGTVGRTLRVLGTLKGEDGLADLEEAVSVLEKSTSRLELARALAAQGTSLRLARKPTAARDPLRRALEIAEVCGAAPLVERVRGELHASGVRPRSTTLSGVKALTPSERRVADLAASGLSNREIAQELYVTPKTVEVHLSSSYRKLEIRGRRELSSALKSQ